MPYVKKGARIFFGVLALLVLALLVAGGALWWRARAPRASDWQTVAPGVEMRTLSVGAGSTLQNTLGGASQIIALRTSPARSILE